MYRSHLRPQLTRRRRTSGLLGGLAVLFLVVLTTSGIGLSVGLGGAVRGGSAPLSGPAAKTLPSLVVAPTSGPVGTAVTFTVSGFAASKAVTIESAVGVIVCSGKTTSKGAFSCGYTIPPTPGGADTFTATDVKGHDESATFTVESVLAVSPASGPVGTTVHFSGTGFGGGSPYTVKVNWTGPSGAVQTACAATTDSSLNGSFGCSFTLLAASGGSRKFTAVSTGTGRSAFTASVDFLVLSSLAVGPSNGPPGTTATFTGTGFGVIVPVSVSWSGGTACSSTTLASGNFSCSWTIPSGAGGTYLLTATDSAGNTATASFVVTFLAIRPTTVSVGSTLTFAGGGYTPTTPISLSWSGGSVCAGTRSTLTGTFTCTYGPFPPTPHGVYVFTASDGLGNYASARISLEPTLTLNTTHGDPGTAVLLTGNGFGALLSVNVTWSPAGPPVTACSASVGTDGTFSCPYTVPALTAGGPYTFVATDTASNSASKTFTVTYLSASPASGPQGTVVTVQGGGFTGNSTFTVTWGAVTVPSSDCTSSIVSSSGTIKCTFTTPAATAGPHPFSASDSTHDAATAPFTVLPHLAASPSQGNVTSTISLALSGFASTEATTVDWGNGSLACSALSTSSGSASCSATLLPTPAGAYVLRASDTSGDNATAVFTVLPSLWVAPGHGLGGTPVVFHGTGFGPSVNVSVSSSLGPACAAKTSRTGSFSCPYTLPYAPSGSYTFHATDALANTAQTTFAITPELTVNVPKGPVGTLLTFRGYGFGAGREANVTWAFGLACQGPVGGSGQFSCSFTLTPSAKASYTFTANDRAAGHGGNTATVAFQVVPSLVVSPTSGPVGTPVTFSGEGYLADTLVTVSWGIGAACSGETGATGVFSCSYTVPSQPSGPHVFTGASSSTDSANTTFSILPRLAISPSSGVVGTTVELNASGLVASAWLNISWAEGVACSGQASAVGLFSCVYVVVAAPQGTHTFTAAVDGVPVANATFRLGPSLTLSPTGGPVGTRIAMSALGFASSQGITISSGLGTSCTGTTSARGSFACNYTVPSAPAQTYTFTAEDALSNVASAPFVVGSVLTVSPRSGIVGSPLRFTATGFGGSTAMTISWSGGTVCTGVTGPGGGFSCNTTVPVAPFGPQLFTARAGPSSSATFSVRPSVRASPTSGPAGGTVSFAGYGFPTGTTVSVTWSGPTICTGPTNASGQFRCSLSIPIGTAGGTYAVAATDLLGHRANTTFTVVTGLVDSPTHGPVLTVVTFTGTNFGPFSPVFLNWSGGVACATSANATGAFTCPFKIPSTAPGGAYRFTASNATVSVSVRFIVTYLNATPTGLFAGQYVNLSGGGFEPNAWFTLTGPWGPVCAGVADGAGAFACRTQVPATLAPGAYNFSANDSFGDLARAGFGVFAIGLPMASPTSVDVNQSVTFSVVASGGAGTLSYLWSGLPHGCPSANSSTVTCEPDQPTVGATHITVLVTDAERFSAASPALSFTVYADPTVSAPAGSPPSADVGQTVTFSTTGSVGSGGTAYAWTSSGSGLNCTLGTLASVSCRPDAPGNYTLSVNVTDSNGVTSATKTSAIYRVYSDPTAVAPTANRTRLDVGQSVSFSTGVHGGSGGDSYTWTAPSALGCPVSSAATLSCTPGPAAAGNSYSVSVTVTDSNRFTSAPAVSGSVTVSSAPSVTTPSANRSAADVGQSVSFSATGSGGTGGYTYHWTTPAGLGCASSSGPSVSCVPVSPANYTISVSVNDTNGGMSPSASLTSYPVSPRPTVTTPLATPSSVDLHGSVTFSTTATVGSGGLRYVWSGLPVGCASTAASFTCTPTAVVADTPVTVTVTDSNDVSVTSGTLRFTVYADPLQAPPSASPPSADVGQPVTFTASVTNGSGAGTYAWSDTGLNCTSSTGPTYRCVPSNPGSFTVSYAWTDSNGVAATGKTSLTFVVSTDPKVTPPAPAPTSADVGQTVVFSTTLTGGSGGPLYTWTETPAGLNCTVSTSDQISCVPAEPGNYSVTVYVTDSNEKASPSMTTPFHVFTDPSVSAPTPSLPSVDVGQPFTFSTSAHGGSGGDSFTWTPQSALTALGCSASTTATLSCTPTSAAAGNTYTVSVTVSDSNKRTSAAASGSVVVLSAVGVAVPTGTPASVDVGQTVVFSTAGSGGAGGYKYTWTETPAGLNCAASTADQISCVPTAAGTYSVSVTTTDANGASSPVETLSAYKVDSRPTVEAPHPNHAGSVDVGATVGFGAKAFNGSGGYSYIFTWQTPFGCTVKASTGVEGVIVCVPTAPGVFQVNVTVTDSNGATATNTSGPYPVYVHPSVTLTLSSTSILQGHSVTFTATTTGGAPGNLAYSWIGVPAGCPATSSLSTTSKFTCTPSTEGQYTIEVTVTDVDKGTGTDYANLTVQPEFIGLPANEGYAIVIGSVVAAIAVVSFLVVRRFRRRRRERQQKEF